jgi:hypothetical protein
MPGNWPEEISVTHGSFRRREKKIAVFGAFFKGFALLTELFCDFFPSGTFFAIEGT